MRAFILTLLVFGTVVGVSPGDAVAQQADRPLKIKSKPSPRTDGECGRSGEGRMRVRVTFGKDAKVSNVEVVEISSCRTFNENAVKAAYRIKFEPAIKNGEAIAVTKQIEYKFEIF